MTLSDALTWGTAALRQHACAAADAPREARDLLAFALSCDTAALLTKAGDRLGESDRARYAALVQRRLRHEPLAHMLGTAMFLGREFRVTRDTLIPRPATEHVVEAALAAAAQIEARALIDVGTGSGIIAASLALAEPRRRIYATDLSPAALGVAKENAGLVRADGILFHCGDLLEPLPPEAWSEPAVIAANLPYIPDGEWDGLIPDIRDYEPKSALVAGPDGLDDYRRLLDQLRGREPARPFAMVMEILPEQAGALTERLAGTWPDAAVQPVRNLAGLVIGLKAVVR
jgi:release factor glutamine methyltransferase